MKSPKREESRRGSQRRIVLHLMLVVGLALPAMLLHPQPAAANFFEDFAEGFCLVFCPTANFTAATECRITQVRAGGTIARHAYEFDVLCDGTPFARVSAVYDFASGKASEKLSSLIGEWSYKSSWRCSDDPWIYGDKPPACGSPQVELRPEGMNPTSPETQLPVSVYSLTAGDRHVLAAQLQNVLNATVPSPVLLPPLVIATPQGAIPPAITPDDLSALHAKGAAIANADPLAAELRNQQPDAPALRGFDIGMAAAEGNTAPGPGKQAIHDALSPAEQGGFDAAVAYSLARNKYADLAATGATIAAADPIVAAARNGQADVLYRLGFDIATGLFGDPALGAKGNTQTGTGSFAIRNSLTAAARRGFNVSVALHLSRDYLLPAKAGEPPVVVSGSCGPPGGTATIVIPDPKLKRLNVRASAGGTVLGTIPEGSQVSIVGVCGAEPAAGLVKPQQPKATGWCQIDAPVLGCVSAKFLDFGGTGAAGVAAGIAKPPATEAEVPAAAAPDFAGEWSSVVDGVAHYITLSQKGGTVKGTYQADDGSSGKIAGKASGNLLRFAWSQADGIAGSGKFILSGDGQSFEGSYNFGDNPDQVEGSWNGSR